MTQPSPADKPLLLCVPCAGASSAKFERLRSRLASKVEVRTAELPGRGIRFNEPSFSDLRQHISHFSNRIESEPYRRWILLGESLGSVTASAVLNQMIDSFEAEILGLIVASSSPKITGRRTSTEVLDSLRSESSNADLDDAAYANISKAVIADLNAASAAGEAILRVRPQPLPVVTLLGQEDSLVSEADARLWEEKSTIGRWMFRSLPGDHYQFDAPSDEAINAVLDGVDFILGT